MTLNLKAPFFLTKALSPQLRAAADDGDPARVINIGSISGVQSGEHVLVNAIAPGPFPSRMMGAQLPQFVEGAPLRPSGAPEDVAGTVIYLCSRAGAFTTGVVLPLDGGASAQAAARVALAIRRCPKGPSSRPAPKQRAHAADIAGGPAVSCTEP